MTKAKTIKFYLINLIFPNDCDTMEFEVDGLYLLFQKINNYNSIENIIIQNYGIADTCFINISIKDSLESTLEFMRRVNFLLSFCRGNIINYSHYVVCDESNIEIKTVSIIPISTPYTSLELIPNEFVTETQKFLSIAYKNYDIIDNLYSIRKLAREYPTTRNSSTFLGSRSLILTAIVEYMLFCFNRNIDNLELLDKEAYLNSLEEIKKELGGFLIEKFGKKNNSKINSILQKLDGLNSRTLNWKFEKFIRHYRISITSDDIKKFKVIRDSLAHTLNFPEGHDEIMGWKFLVTILDKVIMGLFCYEGRYYNFFNDSDEYFHLTSGTT
jgi:hypothetical protein